jgi:hypothetical protein
MKPERLRGELNFFTLKESEKMEEGWVDVLGNLRLEDFFDLLRQ